MICVICLQGVDEMRNRCGGGKLLVRVGDERKELWFDEVVEHVIETKQPVSYGPNGECASVAVTQVNGTVLCAWHGIVLSKDLIRT